MWDVCAQAGHVIEKRKGRLKLGGLAADVQALRDVKHFVKDYKGHLPLSLPTSGIAGFLEPFTCFACMHSCRYDLHRSCISITTKKRIMQIMQQDLMKLLSMIHAHLYITGHGALVTGKMPNACCPFLQLRLPQVPLRLLQAALVRCGCCFKSCCLRRTLLQPLHIAHQPLLLYNPLLPGLSNWPSG